MSGTIRADFAGTYGEARAFAADNGLKAPLRFAYTEELPQVTFPFGTNDQFKQGLDLFNKLGWPRESVEVIHYQATSYQP